jgi:hypothetical protein
MVTISMLKEAGIFITMLILGGAAYIVALGLFFLYQLALYLVKMVQK